MPANIVPSEVTDNVADLYAAAAFLVGEGCFQAVTRANGYMELSVQVSLTEKGPLLWLKSVLGGHINGPYPHTNSSHLPTYRWGETGYAASVIIIRLLPLLELFRSVKETEAREALVKWQSRRYHSPEAGLL